jgi:hypothetical protein
LISPPGWPGGEWTLLLKNKEYIATPFFSGFAGMKKRTGHEVPEMNENERRKITKTRI